MKRLLMFLIAMCLCSHVQALTRGFFANSFVPTVDEGHYLTVYSSKTLKYGEFSEGSSVTYAYHPFQLTQNGSRVQGILDHTLIQNFYLAFGLPDDHLQVGTLIPVGWLLNFKNPSLVDPPGNNKVAVGDIEVNLKASILNLDKYPVGLSILPFFTIPTGNGQYYFGAGLPTGGGKVILEFRPVKNLSISFNPGILGRSNFEFAGTVYGTQLLMGLGVSYQVLDALAVSAEIQNKARLASLYQHKSESPTEALAGIKWQVGKGFTLSGGAGGGIINGSGVPLFRGFASISYSPKLKVIEVE